MQSADSRGRHRDLARCALCILLLAGCSVTIEAPRVPTHPDGSILAHPEPPNVPEGLSFFENSRDIDPLRVHFPDWTLPPGYMDLVAVRAGQFMSNAIRAWHVAPPVSAWIAEKVYLAAALAADTEGRFGNPPSLPRLDADPTPIADPTVAYLVAFTTSVEHYDVSPGRAVAHEAANFRDAWLARITGSRDDNEGAIARGVIRGRHAAARVAASYPRLDRTLLQIAPDDFRRAIADRYAPLGYDARQAWQFTPASEHLERRPFNDYMPVTPGIGRLMPLVKLAPESGTVPPFPGFGSPEWWNALEAVAKYGGFSSLCRVDAQALTGWFFEASASGPPAEAANAVTSVIAYLQLPVAEAARAQFLTWSAMATAGILTWHEKYRHNILRPVTAINMAVGEIEGVPAGWTWETLGPTPPFPAYPSGHAAFTPAAYLTLAMILRERIPDPMTLRVTVASADPHSWNALMNEDGSSVALEFPSLESVISAANESRGYLGIHWEPDGVWGRYLGSLAAARTHLQLMRSETNPTDAAIAFPQAPRGALERHDYDPSTDWLGVTRSWAKQFATSREALTGRDPADTIAFPDLAPVDLPWRNDCSDKKR